MEQQQIEKRKNWIMLLLVLIGIIVLIYLAWHTRTVNIPNLKDITTGNYTLGPDLDPFLFLRYSKTIIENGSLPKIDMMRYVPLGWPTSQETQLLPYMMAYFHKFLNLFSASSIEYSAIVFPVFMFLLTVIVFFFFIRKLFENNEYKNWIAIIATLLLILAPALVYRTVAGIPEKESASFFFLFLTFYFFISAWKSKSTIRIFILSLLSGISMAAMGLIWGGWFYGLISISIFMFIAFLLTDINKKQILIYSTWFLSTIFIQLVASNRYSIKELVISTSSGMGFFIFGLLIIDYLIFKTKIKEIGIIQKIRTKIPDKAISLIVLGIIGVILSSILLGPLFIPTFIKDTVVSLSQPYWDRLSFTVAENRQPYFNEWRGEYGPDIKGLPIFFTLFFLGSILLFYEAVRSIDKKTKWFLTATYAFFLTALIFSRYSSSGSMNGVSFISQALYLLGFLSIVIIPGYFFYKYYKENKLEEFKKIDFSYLFLLVLFVVSLIGARSSIRLLMMVIPAGAAIVGFLPLNLYSKSKLQGDKTFKIIFLISSIVIMFFIAYTSYANYQTTLSITNSMAPSLYTQQWQKAMAWVRNNTPTDAVFAHWWDYGYWVQSIGERATVVDGGNSISYWDYLVGRHVLTGQTEIEALEFLYAHNATYLLIDSSDIGKYPAYASIGGDENYDRYSQISTFTENEKAMQETKNGTIHIYQGSMFLDEDYLINKTFLPSYKSGIAGVILEIENTQVSKATVVFAYNGKQYDALLRYVYYQNKLIDLGEGYGGALYLFPSLTPQSNQQISIKNSGVAMFITQKSMKALWIKLYLLNESENFQLVYQEDSFVTEELKNQNRDVGEIIYFQGIQGPIKIWKINYPSDIKFKPEYLSTIYPASVKKAKPIF